MTSSSSEPRALMLPELERSPPVRLDERLPSAAELERSLELARQEARRAGFEEGRRSEAARLATALDALTAAATQLARADEQRREEATERVAVLATAIASHLVEREVRTAPDVIADVVRRAVAEFPVHDPLTVRLNPSDLALLSSGLSGEAGHHLLTSGQTVRWVPDPTVLSGGCLVEGGESVVDARLSRTLERICRVLVDA